MRLSRFSFGSAHFLACLAALATIGVVTAATASAPSDTPASHTPAYWHPWFEIGGYHNSRENDGVESTGTSGTNRGETTIFAPIRGGQRALLFGQLTAKFFDDSAKEGNLALGYRRMTTSGFNLGAWIGGDVRRSGIDNTFWQLSGGFEALSDRFDARVNWYGPITKPQAGVAGYAQVQLQGNQIKLIGAEEVGMMGVDGEIGFRLPTSFAKLDPNIFELRAYAGGYYFDNSDADQEIAGVKGRLELRVNDIIASLPGSRLTAEYEISHDDVRDTRHDIGLRVRIPLNGGTPARALASLSGQQRRMLDGIERDTDIVTVRSKAEAVADALTGTHFDRVAYANAANSVTAASNAAGDNSLIIVNGEVQGGQELQGNQTLQGGGATIQVRGRRTGLVVPFTAPGAPGRLTTPGDSDNWNLLVNGSNIHVAGITIDGGYDNGGETDGLLIEDDRKNIFLTNLLIENIDESAIEIGDRNEVAILGGVFRNVGYDGEAAIFANNENELVVRGLTIKNADYSGIEIDDNNKSIIISDTRIILTGDSGTGIEIGRDNKIVSISNVFIRSETGKANGLSFTTGNVVDITNLTVDGADRGISMANLDPGGNEVTVVDSSFANITNEVFNAGGAATLKIFNSVFYGAGTHLFSVTNGQLQVRGNTFNGDFGGSLFDFSSSYGKAAPIFLDGSTGNVNNATSYNAICSGIAFGGEFELNGIVLSSTTC